MIVETQPSADDYLFMLSLLKQSFFQSYAVKNPAFFPLLEAFQNILSFLQLLSFNCSKKVAGGAINILEAHSNQCWANFNIIIHDG